MIPKIITALISAAILSAFLGALPCEATGAKHRPKANAAATSVRPTGAADLNSPATDFSGVKPVLDNPHPDLVPPKQDHNQFFDETLR